MAEVIAQYLSEPKKVKLTHKQKAIVVYEAHSEFPHYELLEGDELTAEAAILYNQPLLSEGLAYNSEFVIDDTIPILVNSNLNFVVDADRLNDFVMGIIRNREEVTSQDLERIISQKSIGDVIAEHVSGKALDAFERGHLLALESDIKDEVEFFALSYGLDAYLSHIEIINVADENKVAEVHYRAQKEHEFQKEAIDMENKHRIALIKQRQGIDLYQEAFGDWDDDTDDKGSGVVVNKTIAPPGSTLNITQSYYLKKSEEE